MSQVTKFTGDESGIATKRANAVSCGLQSLAKYYLSCTFIFDTLHDPLRFASEHPYVKKKKIKEFT
jgi:hypothetical protein